MMIAGLGATLSGTYIHISSTDDGSGDPKLGTRTNEAPDATLERTEIAAKLLRKREEIIVIVALIDIQ
jgi:paraquat-inducible protein B